jgi:4-amino-4-deoxy-L-arabinose transferase-like glycosyltransferase
MNATPARRTAPALWLPLAASVLLLGWIYLHRVAANPPKWEEPRRCLVALEMVERGDYVVPRVLGRPYHNKPPLHAWTLALASGFRFERIGPAAARSVSVVALLAICLALWRLGVSGSDPRPDPLPSLVFATSGSVLQFGRAGEIDLLFCAWIVGALASFELGRRREAPWLRWGLSQLLVGAAVLTKGFAPLLVYPPLLWTAWRDRGRGRPPVGWVLLGLAGMLAVSASWLVPYANAADVAGLAAGWRSELAHVTVGDETGGLLRHLVSYPLVVAGVALPWSLVLLGAGRSGAAAFRAGVRHDPWLRLSAAVVVWIVLVYVVVPGTHGRYLIPGLPFAAVWAAALLRRSAMAERLRRLLSARFALALPAVAGAAYAVVAGMRLTDRRIEMAFSLAAVAAAPAVVLWLRRARLVGAPAATLLAAALVYGALVAGVWEGHAAERGAADERVARELARAVDEPLPLVFEGDRGEWLRVGFLLSHQIGRVPQAEVEEGAAHFRLRRARKPAPEGAALVASDGGFSLYRVGGSP